MKKTKENNDLIIKERLKEMDETIHLFDYVKIFCFSPPY